MNGKIAVVLLSGLLFACVPPPPPPPAPPPPPPVAAPAPAPVPAVRTVSIRTATCDRLLQLSNEDRAQASMFYIGYAASRAGSRVIEVNQIPVIEAGALNLCAARPNRTVASAFVEAYARLR